MAEKNIRLTIEYDGGEYNGWQSQPDGNTVQDKITDAIKQVTGEKVILHGAGRTDSGVHALGQVANFKIDHNLLVDQYKDAVNHYVPRSIVIKDSLEVDDKFDARYSALWRKYRYIISPSNSALYYKYRYEYTYPLNLDRMSEIAQFILGVHDFSAFCKAGSLKENNECEIYESCWKPHGSLILFEIKANRFLHTMVRSLVGSMILAGRENDYLTLKNFEDIMLSKDHSRLKMVAPARGLYLVEVGYE